MNVETNLGFKAYEKRKFLYEVRKNAQKRGEQVPELIEDEETPEEGD